jgi:hypothetical protein
MTKKFLILFAMAAAFASAATYRVRLLQPTVIAGTTLKAGEYKLQIQDNKAVFSAGKNTAEATVKVENADQKYTSTSFRYDRATDGALKLQELRLAGTNTKLVFTN